MLAQLCWAGGFGWCGWHQCGCFCLSWPRVTLMCPLDDEQIAQGPGDETGHRFAAGWFAMRMPEGTSGSLKEALIWQFRGKSPRRLLLGCWERDFSPCFPAVTEKILCFVLAPGALWVSREPWGGWELTPCCPKPCFHCFGHAAVCRDQTLQPFMVCIGTQGLPTCARSFVWKYLQDQVAAV